MRGNERARDIGNEKGRRIQMGAKGAGGRKQNKDREGEEEEGEEEGERERTKSGESGKKIESNQKRRGTRIE